MSIQNIIEEQKLRSPTKIKVIGVGGGGCNAVDRMVESGMRGVEFICINTDLQPLQTSPAEVKIQIGKKITKGLGTGYNPEIGRLAAEEQVDQITEVLQGANMVFLTAGMGGGTGTGASPIIAQVAKKLEILTVAVVTKPFDFEGKKRMEIALSGIEKLKKEVDTIIIISNNNLLSLNQEKLSITNAFALGDSVLMNGVKGISDLVLNHSPGSINVDFADVKTIMKSKGTAIMSMATLNQDSSIEEVVKRVVNNPLVEYGSIQGATGLLVNLTHGKETSLRKAVEIIRSITEQVDREAVCIHGFLFDASMGKDIKITVIATGFDDSLIRRKKIGDNLSQALNKKMANPFDIISDSISPFSDEKPLSEDNGNRKKHREHVFSADPVLKKKNQSEEKKNFSSFNDGIEEVELEVRDTYPQEIEKDNLEIPAFLRRNRKLNL